MVLPGYAFEAVPFRWLSRASLYQDIGLVRTPAFSPDAEDAVDVALGWRKGPSWVTDGGNQRAVIEASSRPSWSATRSSSMTTSPNRSQGSEFGTTFLVLPARTNVSRELMYTALTRQRDRVVILHERTLDDLRDLAQPWRSETARRLTDLFSAPDPVVLELRGSRSASTAGTCTSTPTGPRWRAGTR